MNNLMGGIGRAFLLVILSALPAQAQWVTINITGIIDTVDDRYNYLEGKIHVGDNFTGWYTFNTDTPDSLPLDPTQGYYIHNQYPAGVNIIINDFIFKTKNDSVHFDMTITNNDNFEDYYGFVSWNNDPLPSGIPVEGIDWQLTDYQHIALQSDSLLPTAPILNSWQINYLSISTTRMFSIGGHVTSVTPEPGTLILLSFGVFGILRRKFSRN